MAALWPGLYNYYVTHAAFDKKAVLSAVENVRETGWDIDDSLARSKQQRCGFAYVHLTAAFRACTATYWKSGEGLAR